MKLIRYSVLAVLFTVLSCASENRSTEGDKQLHYQNFGASKKIQSVSNDPAVLVPAVDIEKNSQTLLDSQGMPKNPQPYSSSASEESRKQSKEEHSTSWYTVVGLTLLGIILPIAANSFAPGLGNVITNVLGGAFKSKGMKTTEATFAGVEQFMRANPQMAKPLAQYVERAQKKLGVDSFAGKILAHVKSNVLPTMPTTKVEADVPDTPPPATPRVPGS